MMEDLHAVAVSLRGKKATSPTEMGDSAKLCCVVLRRGCLALLSHKATLYCLAALCDTMPYRGGSARLRRQ